MKNRLKNREKMENNQFAYNVGNNYFIRKCDAIAFSILQRMSDEEIVANYKFGNINLAGYNKKLNIGVFCGYPIMIDGMNVINIDPGSSYDTIRKKIISELQFNRNTWYCTICGVDMGECNPRQYCCKTYCPYEI